MGRHLYLLMEKKDSFGHGYCHGSHRGGQEENRGCRRERETEQKRRHQKIYTSQVKVRAPVEGKKAGGGERGAIDTGHFDHRGPDCSAVLV